MIPDLGLLTLEDLLQLLILRRRSRVPKGDLHPGGEVVEQLEEVLQGNFGRAGGVVCLVQGVPVQRRLQFLVLADDLW